MTSQFACVFPGQGSQSVGMLKELAEKFPLVTATFREASEVLGYDLWELTQAGPAEQLDQTEFTQPAMLVAGVSVWRVWCELTKQRPQLIAGHSLGEYSALVAAESLAFKDAVKLVSLRGKLMQQAVPAGLGAMAAIVGLTDEQVTELCHEAAQNEVVKPANFNAIGQVVIAGHRTAVERAIVVAERMGAGIAKLIPVSAPAHSPLMKEAAEKFALELNQITVHAPKIAVLHNVDVSSKTDPAEIRAALVAQLYSPVRWVEIVQKMHAMGITTLVECGPGRVLMKLTRRIVKDLTAVAIDDPASLDKFLTTLA